MDKIEMPEISDFERRINQTCENLGEAEVRARLRKGVWGGKNKLYVEGWLEKREHDERVSNNTAQTELARAAADAARDAADAASDQAASAREANRLAERANDRASTANMIATLALIAAIIAIAVSAIGLFFR